VGLGRRFETLVATKVAGARLDPDRQKWLENLPTDIKERLIEFELAERAKPIKTLSDHIEDHKTALTHKGPSEPDTALEVRQR
jgi:hypothetical protein